MFRFIRNNLFAVGMCLLAPVSGRAELALDKTIVLDVGAAQQASEKASKELQELKIESIQWVGDDGVLRSDTVEKKLGHGVYGTALLVNDPIAREQFVVTVTAKEDHRLNYDDFRSLLALDAYPFTKHLQHYTELGDCRVVGIDGSQKLVTGFSNQLVYPIDQQLKGQKLTLQERLLFAEKVMDQTLTALAELNALGFVHRDVKDANIALSTTYEAFMAGKGKVILIDFGLSHPIRAEGPAKISGTPECLAPEIITDPKHVNYQLTDLYALGATLFKIVSGNTPFHDAVEDLGVKSTVTALLRRDLHKLATDKTARFFGQIRNSGVTGPHVERLERAVLGFISLTPADRLGALSKVNENYAQSIKFTPSSGPSMGCYTVGAVVTN